MTKQGDFLIYCVETYKNAKHLTGRQVAELFTRMMYGTMCIPALKPCTPPGPIILWRTSTSILRQGSLLWLKTAPKTAQSPFISAYKPQKYMQKKPIGAIQSAFSISEKSTAPFT